MLAIFNTGFFPPAIATDCMKLIFCPLTDLSPSQALFLTGVNFINNLLVSECPVTFLSVNSRKKTACNYLFYMYVHCSVP